MEAQHCRHMCIGDHNPLYRIYIADHSCLSHIALHVLQAGKDIDAINKHLKKYPAAIDNFIDVWMVVKVGDPKYVYEWRLEAEQKSKAAGKSGMTDEQVADFVDRYMPGYVHYLPGLYSQGPTTKQSGKVLTIQIDKTRQLTKQQPEQYSESEPEQQSESDQAQKRLRTD